MTSRPIPALALAFFLLPAPSAPAAGPFTAMAGAWNGAGTITATSGDNERVRCRVTNDVNAAGDELRQELRCASDSYRITLTSTARVIDGFVQGRWSESTRNVAGTLSGRLTGQTISVRIEGGGFTASMSVTTRGNSQSVTLRTDTEIREIQLQLRKG